MLGSKARRLIQGRKANLINVARGVCKLSGRKYFSRRNFHQMKSNSKI